ncbi:MAG TPA: hypothetical protein VMA96_12170 [Solirubrobacteraceae bacterium]|nr:hypothetical protein [Solirubrobacteraceae bacterium]
MPEPPEDGCFFVVWCADVCVTVGAAAAPAVPAAAASAAPVPVVAPAVVPPVPPVAVGAAVAE